MAFERQTAHRAFALEFNASRHEIKGQGEKEPSFLVTPLGAKINRIHVVGVCTDVEPVGESGEVWRARISDPSGVFTVYAGNYQPEAAQALSQIQAPQYVAVTGKARTYEPEPGSVFVSIRPESVTVVDQATRDQWILDTARRTSERLAAVQAVRKDPKSTGETLVAQGHAKVAADGALLAQERYGLTDVSRYGETVRNSVSYLLPGKQVPVHRIESRKDADGAGASAATETPAWRPSVPEATAPDAAKDALDDAVFAHVTRLQGSKGARWDEVQGAAAVGGVTPEDVEESLNRLMDKGLIYEPTLGVLRTT